MKTKVIIVDAILNAVVCIAAIFILKGFVAGGVGAYVSANGGENIFYCAMACVAGVVFLIMDLCAYFRRNSVINTGYVGISLGLKAMLLFFGTMYFVCIRMWG